jgi:dipeptidyl aminopeptidase/acylaminoacyl peptidase
LDSHASQPVVAPFGTWPSPVTADLVARAGTRQTAPFLAGGTAWWLEGRPLEGGRIVLMRATPGGEPEDVTPAGFNVRTMVHEYGGGAYCVHDGVVFFSNFDDQRLYRQDPGAPPVPITPETESRHRYADGRVTADGTLWIGVRERHEGSGLPEEVVNELVAIPTDGSGEPRVVAGGRDFYAAPRISPDGTKLCFLAWNLPWMPWDGCELFSAELRPDGSLGEIEHVAGRDGTESIWQPEWSRPAGDLVFVSDRSGWWNLERVREGARQRLHPAEAEFGYPAWTLGASSYAFLGDGRIVCGYEHEGRTRFGVLDPESGELGPLDLPYDAWRTPFLAAEGSTALLVAGSAVVPSQVARLELATGSSEVLRESSRVDVDPAWFSVPEAIEFPTEGGLTAHALFYPPANPDFVAPEGERPPLIVMSHGGPTGSASPVFSLEKQFWTSRGFAVVDVNYGGSTGYGRAFRERLNGQWGVIDLQDCVNAAHWLVERGEADPERLLITGGSAGGYTTICALTFTDEFAAGASYFGLADLEQFGQGDTHKFELRYEHTLVGPYPERADLYRERSPIHFVDRISTPMLVLQGADDKIVPPSHAEVIVEALRENGIPHAYLLFEGEGHGFRKAENIVASLEAELSFYAQILGFEPADRLPRLELEHLAA